MTDFYAIYLFIILSLILFIVGLWFKKYAWIFWLAGIGWGMTGIYCMVEGYGTSATYTVALGMFSLAFSIACWLAPMFIRNSLRTEEPPVKSAREIQIEGRSKRMNDRKTRSTGLMPKNRQWYES